MQPGHSQKEVKGNAQVQCQPFWGMAGFSETEIKETTEEKTLHRL
jgi:hypothetical protein